MATAPIALTGATGRIGGRVADRLATKGVPLRLLVRDPDRAPDLPGATAVVAPFADGEAVREALTGVETAFMVSASEAADRVQQHLTFVEAAAAAGVRHLVYLSFQGASAASTFTFARDHAVTEAAIRGTGLTWTFLRDSFYADFMPGLVGDDGVIRGPGGSGRVAVVAQDDIADAAAAVLLDPAAAPAIRPLRAAGQGPPSVASPPSFPPPVSPPPVLPPPVLPPAPPGPGAGAGAG